jgi:hypothetical protein
MTAHAGIVRAAELLTILQKRKRGKPPSFKANAINKFLAILTIPVFDNHNTLRLGGREASGLPGVFNRLICNQDAPPGSKE